MTRLSSQEWLRLIRRVNHGWGDTDPNPEATARYYNPPPVPPSSGHALAKQRKEQGVGASPRLNRPRLVR